MIYVLVRNRPMANGHTAYVARSGSEKSYTASVKQARIFQSEAAAEAERCGNEAIRPLDIDGQFAFDW